MRATYLPPRRYDGGVHDEISNSDENSRVGLCIGCTHARRVAGKQDHAYYLCQLSLTDANFSKYPHLPVLQCLGFERESKVSRGSA